MRSSAWCHACVRYVAVPLLIDELKLYWTTWLADGADKATKKSIRQVVWSCGFLGVNLSKTSCGFYTALGACTDGISWMRRRQRLRIAWCLPEQFILRGQQITLRRRQLRHLPATIQIQTKLIGLLAFLSRAANDADRTCAGSEASRGRTVGELLWQTINFVAQPIILNAVAANPCMLPAPN